MSTPTKLPGWKLGSPGNPSVKVPYDPKLTICNAHDGKEVGWLNWGDTIIGPNGTPIKAHGIVVDENGKYGMVHRMQPNPNYGNSSNMSRFQGYNNGYGGGYHSSFQGFNGPSISYNGSGGGYHSSFQGWNSGF